MTPFLPNIGMGIASLIILFISIIAFFKRQKELKVDEKTKNKWRKKGLI